MSEISALMKKTPWSSLAPPPSEGTAGRWQLSTIQEGPSPDTEPASTLTLGSQPPGLLRISHLVCDVVKAAQTH